MSIRSLLTSNVKSSQNPNVNDLSCVDLSVSGSFLVNTIQADTVEANTIESGTIETSSLDVTNTTTSGTISTTDITVSSSTVTGELTTNNGITMVALNNQITEPISGGAVINLNGKSGAVLFTVFTATNSPQIAPVNFTFVNGNLTANSIIVSRLTLFTTGQEIPGIFLSHSRPAGGQCDCVWYSAVGAIANIPQVQWLWYIVDVDVTT